jgi:glycosyltransferase involved in cell wall biosynthesis
MIIPSVSIGIITYNHSQFIEECLDSIRTQTYQDFEVFISDDCSTDNTSDIIENYLRKYPNFRATFFRQENNLGVTKNSNFVFHKSDSKYSVIFAGDDVMMPDRLEIQVAVLDKNSQASFCYSNCEWFHSNSGRKICNHFGFLQKPPQNLYDLISDFTIPTPTMMMRRSMAPKYGYDDRLAFFSDFMMAVDLWQKGEAIFIPQNLVKYRKHSLSIMSTNLCIDDRKELLSIFTERFIGFPQMMKAIENYRSIYNYAVISDLIKNKDFRAAFKLIPKVIFKIFSSVKWFVRCLKIIKDFITSFTNQFLFRYKHD